MNLSFSKLIIGLLSLISILTLANCNNDDEIITTEISDKRYKLVFSGPREGYIIGDDSHKLIKSFLLDNQDYPIEYGGDFYYNNDTRDIFIFGSKTDGRNLLYKIGVDKILNNENYIQTVEATLIDIPSDELMIKGFVTSNETIYTLSKLKDVNSDEKDIYLRKHTNGNSQIVFKISEILGFHPHFTDFYSGDIEYFYDSEELIFRTGRYNETFLLSVNLKNEMHSTFNGILSGHVFGTRNEYFMWKWEEQANDELFDVLFDQFENKIGQIAVGTYFGSSRNLATYTYDPIDEQIEFIQKSDGVSQIGIFKPKEFSFEILSGASGVLKSIESPIFYVSNEN